MSTSSSPCPTPETWHNLLEERLTEPEKTTVLAHIGACATCLEHMAQRVSEPGLVPSSALLNDGDPRTQELLAQLAEAGPPQGTGEAGELADVVSPPQIPGLAGFVLVGRGGMGAVFRAWETTLERPVAVKLFSSVAQAGLACKARARREALMLAQLQHPHVVQIHSSGEVNGVPYLVMEWVPGGTLQERLSNRGPLSPVEAATVAQNLAWAVAEVHALGMIHRDLKPDNVLLVEAVNPGGLPVPKLADFGLARPEEDANTPGLTEHGMIVGTPCYMAPEQTGLSPSLGSVGPATDIHGLGAVLYAMVAGQAPYKANSSLESLQRSAQGLAPRLSAIRPGLSEDFRTIVEKCLQPVPARRYRSAGELADDLTRFLEGLPILARPIGPVERLAKWVRRRPVLAVATALGGLLMVLTAGAAFRNAYMANQVSQALLERNNALKLGETALLEKNQALRVANQALEREKKAVEKRQEILASMHNALIQQLIRRGGVLDPQHREFLLNVRKQYLDWPLEPDPLVAHKYRAEGLLALLQVFLELHHYEDAYQSAMAALAEYDRAVELAPGQIDIAKRRLEVGTLVHSCMNKTNRSEEAVKTSKQLIARAERLLEKAPSVRPVLARALGDYAYDLMSLRQSAESGQLATRALELYKQARLADPANESIRQDELRVNYNAVLCLDAGGQSKASQAAQFQVMLELAEDAANVFPQNRLHYQKFQRLALLGLAGVYRELGRFDKAMETVNRNLEICRAALNSHPENQDLTELSEGLIDSAIVKLEICSAQGRPLDGRADLESAVQMARLNRDKEPAAFGRTWSLLRILLRRADFLTVTHDSDDARRQLEEVLELTKPWVKQQNRSPEILEFQSHALHRLIHLAIHKFESGFAQGMPQVAQADLESAVQMARLYTNEEPTIFERTLGLCRVLLRWADFLTVTQRPDAAIPALKDVLQLTQDWQAQSKEHTQEIMEYQSLTLNRLIQLTATQGDHAGCVHWTLEKLKIATSDERPQLVLQLGKVQLSAVGKLWAGIRNSLPPRKDVGSRQPDTVPLARRNISTP